MAMTLVNLPRACLLRAYRLSRRWGTTTDRAIEFLIDDASQRLLSVEEWQLCQIEADAQLPDGPDEGGGG